jgi:branched-chain amino acid transport system substrate-binding protein
VKVALAAVAIALAWSPARAEVGVSKDEIRIGQTMPYSGPLSGLGAVGRAEAAYFARLNEAGGINGRKVNLISLDDAFSPPKTFEQTRKLVEQEDVFLIFGSLGTATNTAIHRYLNGKKVPQLFVATGATKWADPKSYPWTMPGMATYDSEGAIYAKYVVQTRPDARIAILYQNDDFGRDYVAGFKRALGPEHAAMIVAEQTYELSAPTIGSQLASLKASGADALFAVTLGRFGAQTIRGVAELGWRPGIFLVPYSSTGLAILEAAGLDNAIGLVSSSFQKNVDDEQWANDADVKDYFAFMKSFLPDADARNSNYSYGYLQANLLATVLRNCGDDLTRDNVLRQATSLHGVSLPLLLPGVAVNTSPEDYLPFRQLRMQRFDGKRWVSFGVLLSDR